MTAQDYIRSIILIVIALPLYWGVLRTPLQRQWLLGMISTIILTLASPRSLVVPLLGGLTTFYLAQWIRRSPSLLKLWVSLALPLGLLLSYRYLQPLAHDAGFIERVAIPIGLSYYTFKQMHFLIEAFRGEGQAISLGSYTLYLIYFPMILSGPIERSSAFNNELRNGAPSLSTVSEAIERLVFGFTKAFVLSQMLLEPALAPNVDIATLLALDWPNLLALAFIKFLRVYFDFSGYTDIAIGISLLFNIRLMENFRAPSQRPISRNSGAPGISASRRGRATMCTTRSAAVTTTARWPCC